MSSLATWVGLDLGGTSIKAGSLDSSGGRRRRLQGETKVSEGPEPVVRRMADLARALGVQASVGIGVPGLVDHARGLVTHCPNLAPLEGFPLRRALANELGLEEHNVRIENDACVAAMGEHWLGGARGINDVLMVTLGTGIGGGLILGGQLFTGAHGLAAEIGHICVDPEGPVCGCGHRGCMEALASASSASRRAQEAGLPEDLAELAARSRQGDSACSKFLHTIGLDLGRGLGSALMILDLQAFLIGGGFGAALDQLQAGIKDGILERSYGRTREQLRILPAELGADAGWIGAAKLGSAGS